MSEAALRLGAFAGAFVVLAALKALRQIVRIRRIACGAGRPISRSSFWARRLRVASDR
jgi:hypothetical protein